MRSKFFRMTLLIVFSIWIVPAGVLVSVKTVAAEQGSNADDQKYTGKWIGSYSNDKGGRGDLSYVFSKDDKGLWRGSMKWTDKDVEQTADFKTLQIAGGKLKGKIESPDGRVEIAIEGQFQADRLEGTYAISPKGSTEVTVNGTWKVTKSTAAKPKQ